MNSHSDGLAMATSQGVSVLVPFFGGDDDIAALLLALAIIERDSTTELVILSFLEPEKPISGGGGGGGGVNDSESMRRADGGHRKQDVSIKKCLRSWCLGMYDFVSGYGVITDDLSVKHPRDVLVACNTSYSHFQPATV